eukprot:2117032-Amphidinium_carterae.1
MLAGEEVMKEESKEAKLYRRKALQLMASIDHIQSGCFQSTLARFVVDAELRGGLSRDSLGLNLICDQGPDNMAALAFMNHVGCIAHVVFDAKRRCWNDARAALVAPCGGGTVASSTVVLNWGSAPFGSAGFHATAQVATRRLQGAAVQLELSTCCAVVCCSGTQGGGGERVVEGDMRSLDI